MVSTLPVGPYRMIPTAEGHQIPYYIVPFDKNGVCTGPRTRADLIARAAAGGFSDIFLFSHGWNNGFADAAKHYDDFINGFIAMRRTRNLALPAGYAPLLVGIIWPSKLLITQADQAPGFAGDEGPGSGPDDEAVGEQHDEVAEIGAILPRDSAGRFYELAQQDSLTEAEALELATLLAPIYAGDGDETGEPPPTPAQMVDSWLVRRRRPRSDDEDDFDSAPAPAPAPAGPADGPQAAGAFDFLDPRQIVRGASVWLMKDRAGAVGGRGVGPLLAELLKAGAKVHVVGHSFGAKVMLSAVTRPAALPGRVESALLLEPAVSHLCFATDAGAGRPGGYRPALDRIRQPILSTFSGHDQPLTKFFHLALRRSSDLGEQIAGDEPPSRFAALGGFGPRGLGTQSTLIDVLDPTARYPLSRPGVEVFGVNSTRTISGHSEVINASTWWMLYNQLMSGA